jgi:acetyltransferase-like isoleucine patch superfamily enzyme
MLRTAWVRVRYNDHSVATYFRGQGASIGEGTRILTRDIGSEPYLVTIGDRTLISSDVAFYTHDGAVWVLRDREPTLNRFGRITVGAGCFIGARTTLLPNASIGDGSVIGAGSVVSGDIPAGVVAAGVPARVICTVAEWGERVRAASLPLPPELFPLERGDRDRLRVELEKLLPPVSEAHR